MEEELDKLGGLIQQAKDLLFGLFLTVPVLFGILMMRTREG